MSTNAVVPTNHEDRREIALLKAVGLDRAAPEQRELAVKIAEQYGLDLFLKHLVLVEGRPYITRDGLLHVAHRSGQLDGIEVTPPIVVDGFWRSTCSVYRKDMSRPFTYTGRYPTSGGNAKYAPEMAVKVGEVMALRRAFDVAAPVMEERWDLDMATEPQSTQPSLAETARARAAAVATPVVVEPLPVNGEQAAAQEPTRPADSAAGGARDGEAAADPEAASASGSARMVQCESLSPIDGAQCRNANGHSGLHRTHDQSWPEPRKS